MLCNVLWGPRMAQWWYSGESPLLPPMWLVFNSSLGHMWVGELLVFSLTRGLFSRLSSFPSSTKTNTPNFNSTRIEDSHENQLRLIQFFYSLQFQLKTCDLPVRVREAVCVCQRFLTMIILRISQCTVESVVSNITYIVSWAYSSSLRCSIYLHVLRT